MFVKFNVILYGLVAVFEESVEKLSIDARAFGTDHESTVRR